MSAAITAIVAVTAATAVYSGESQRKASKKALRSQREAQRQSLLRSVSQEKLATQEAAKANRKQPNVPSLLFSERARADMGAGSTILAGSSGGGTPLLGSKSSLMGGQLER